MQLVSSDSLRISCLFMEEKLTEETATSLHTCSTRMSSSCSQFSGLAFSLFSQEPQFTKTYSINSLTSFSLAHLSAGLLSMIGSMRKKNSLKIVNTIK